MEDSHSLSRCLHSPLGQKPQHLDRHGEPAAWDHESMASEGICIRLGPGAAASVRRMAATLCISPEEAVARALALWSNMENLDANTCHGFPGDAVRQQQSEGAEPWEDLPGIVLGNIFGGQLLPPLAKASARLVCKKWSVAVLQHLQSASINLAWHMPLVSPENLSKKCPALRSVHVKGFPAASPSLQGFLSQRFLAGISGLAALTSLDLLGWNEGLCSHHLHELAAATTLQRLCFAIGEPRHRW